MQFKRLKVLMLILFLMLDIFLFHWWRTGQSVSSQITDANAELISDMKKQKIKLPNFSTKVNYVSYIAGKSATKQNIGQLPSGFVTNKSSQQDSALVGESKQSNLSYATIKKLAEANNYYYNTLLTQAAKSGQQIYSQKINGLLVLDDSGTMIFNIGKNKRVTVIKKQLANIQKLRDDRATITEEEAIVDLYRYNEIDSGDQLSAGQLTYDKMLSANGYDIYLPVWAFTVKDGKTYDILKVNAFTGDNLTE